MFYYTQAELALFKTQNEQAAYAAETLRRAAAASRQPAPEQPRLVYATPMTEYLRKMQQAEAAQKHAKDRHYATAMPVPSGKAGYVLTRLDTSGGAMNDHAEIVSVPDYLARYRRYRSMVFFLGRPLHWTEKSVLFLEDAKIITRITGWTPGVRSSFLCRLGFGPRRVR